MQLGGVLQSALPGSRQPDAPGRVPDARLALVLARLRHLHARPARHHPAAIRRLHQAQGRAQGQERQAGGVEE